MEGAAGVWEESALVFEAATLLLSWSVLPTLPELVLSLGAVPGVSLGLGSAEGASGAWFVLGYSTSSASSSSAGLVV